jgi:hypothetical protein
MMRVKAETPTFTCKMAEERNLNGGGLPANDQTTFVTKEIGNGPFSISSMHFDQNLHEDQLQAKITAVTSVLRKTPGIIFDENLLQNVEIFRSPSKHLRQRCSFEVRHFEESGDMGYFMWDFGAPTVAVKSFPVASEIINACMPVLRELLNSPRFKQPLSLIGLRSVKFHGSLAGDLLVKLTYKSDQPVPDGLMLGDEWRASATELRSVLTQRLVSSETKLRRIDLIGRARGEKVVLERDFIMEEFRGLVPCPVPGVVNTKAAEAAGPGAVNLVYKQVRMFVSQCYMCVCQATPGKHPTPPPPVPLGLVGWPGGRRLLQSQRTREPA